MHSRQHKVQQGFHSGASAADPGKDVTGRFPALIVIVLAAALMMLAGCVDSEEDFIAEHPAPSSSSSSGSSSSGADPSGSSLTCSDISGDGTTSDPGVLGTAPVCFRFETTSTVYYSVVIPNTGLWFFQVVNLTGDMDIKVYTSTSYSTLLCSSANSGTSDDFCSVDITTTGTGGIEVINFDGGFNFYRLEVVQ